MRQFFREWEKITSDHVILEAVKGYKIEFDPKLICPTRTNVSRQYKRSASEIINIQEELKNLKIKNVIEHSSPCVTDGFVSNIFTRPKKNGGVRLILDLSDLNEYVVKQHFKMDNIHTVACLLTPNCYMASVDLQDAYYSISIEPEFRKYLQFTWQGHHWQYKALPNGLSSAPRLFTKMLKPIFASLREAGHVILGYLDDIIIIGETKCQVEAGIRATTQAFSKLGFKIHLKKSVLKPVQEIQFLGFMINTVDMKFKLPADKVLNIKLECETLLSQPEPTIRQVAHVVGKLISTFPAVQYGPLFYRNLEKGKIIALKRNSGHFDRKMVLSNEAKKELLWWLNHIQYAFSPISREKPSHEIRTDASGSGWGATNMHIHTGGRWNESELEKAKDNEINFLETLAIGFGLKSFHNQTMNAHVLIRSDNTTAVAYINNMGGIKSPHCNQMAVDIWKWCIERTIWITAAYLPGKQNTEADHKSRHFNDRTEWMLNNGAFAKIVQKFGKPEIDIFASRLNTKLARYISWLPDPNAEAVDAFTLDWAKFEFYAFPPFCLVARCIQKIKTDKATGILIVPKWPTQAWFPCLSSILVGEPFLLRRNVNLLTQPSSRTPHPLHDRLGPSGNDFVNE